MDDETQRRAARNESLFRETNEAIERGHWPNEPDKLVRFRCECARLECSEAVSLTLAEYEQVRSGPRVARVRDSAQQRRPVCRG
jgi:hypothetical protein